MKKIAVLIDFTSISEIAIEHAAIVVRGSKTPLVLVNISDPSQKDQERAIKEKMKTFAGLLDREEIPYMLKIGYGEFFSTIPDFLTKIGVDFVIVGTHGIKGIADVSYGLNILRLVESMNQPILIVQGHSEAPHEGYDSILIPNILNNEPVTNEQTICDFSNYFHSKITLLDFMKNENDTSKAEIQYTKQFDTLGKEIEYDYEIVSDYIHTYSRSIGQYASIEDINLMIWSNPKGRDMFNDEDKENLILNRYGIAVLYIP